MNYTSISSIFLLSRIISRYFNYKTVQIKVKGNYSSFFYSKFSQNVLYYWQILHNFVNINMSIAISQKTIIVGLKRHQYRPVIIHLLSKKYCFTLISSGMFYLNAWSYTVQYADAALPCWFLCYFSLSRNRRLLFATCTIQYCQRATQDYDQNWFR